MVGNFDGIRHDSSVADRKFLCRVHLTFQCLQDHYRLRPSQRRTPRKNYGRHGARRHMNWQIATAAAKSSSREMSFPGRPARSVAPLPTTDVSPVPRSFKLRAMLLFAVV
jgi:hypothetical protein